MSVKQEVETKRIGFGFSLSIEKEIRTETTAKYPDKTVLKAGLEGNADTFDEAVELLNRAKEEILETSS